MPRDEPTKLVLGIKAGESIVFETRYEKIVVTLVENGKHGLRIICEQPLTVKVTRGSLLGENRGTG